MSLPQPWKMCYSRLGATTRAPIRRTTLLLDPHRVAVTTRRCILGLVGVTFYYSSSSTIRPVRSIAFCEKKVDVEVTTTAVVEPEASLWVDRLWWEDMVSSVYRAFRMLTRCLHLMVTFAPMISLYPFYRCLLLCQPDPPVDASTDAQDIALGLQYQDCLVDEPTVTLHSSFANALIQLYYKLCLYCVEQSGATIVKFMQWVSTRPDLFGYNFCLIFQQLQDHTTPHARCHTEQMLSDAYGPDWADTIQLGPVIGSGCIGQVYRGTVVVPSAGETPQPVAIKVLHPRVRQSIDTDLDILRCIVRIIPFIPFTSNIYEQCKWLNLNGIVEEFALLLRMQMDLRNEAEHLQKFNRNFLQDPVIQFPQLIPHPPPTPNILMETFCEGASFLVHLTRLLSYVTVYVYEDTDTLSLSRNFLAFQEYPF